MSLLTNMLASKTIHSYLKVTSYDTADYYCAINIVPKTMGTTRSLATETLAVHIRVINGFLIHQLNVFVLFRSGTCKVNSYKNLLEWSSYIMVSEVCSAQLTGFRKNPLNLSKCTVNSDDWWIADWVSRLLVVLLSGYHLVIHIENFNNSFF